MSPPAETNRGCFGAGASFSPSATGAPMLPQLWKWIMLGWRNLRTAGSPSRATFRKNRKPLLELLEDRCTPSVVNWTGNGDGVHWVDAQNWDTNAQPDATSDVRIAAGFT